MPSLEEGIYDLGRLDRLAYLDTAVHRIDPRAKVITTLVFIVCVVSFGKYEVLPMVPFVLYPVVLATEGDLPLGFLLRKIVTVAPFAVLVGIFNPLLDREVIAYLGGVGISGGWISFSSILLRFFLTTIAALVLIATTSFSGVCVGLGKLGLPDVLVTQLLLLYRYIFVLGEETMRMARARALRSFKGHGMGLAVYGQILGHLLLRTYARATRVYQAMLARGFDGRVRILRELHFTMRDAAFVFGWSALFLAFRLYNVPAPSRPIRDGTGLMSHHSIEVSDLGFTYPDGTAALDAVSFRIGHGESIALVGANGAGKSTLLMHLNGFLLPSCGAVRIGEVPVGKGTVADIRKTIGMVFQDPDDQLFMPTVSEDVAFGPMNLGLPVEEIQLRVDDALERVGALHLADRPPYRLSGGEKRAVAIATVLAMAPSILVMDEPSSNLDPRARRRLITLLDTFDHTKIIATHDLDMAMDLCERTIVMSDGTITADGPTHEIFADDALLEASGLEKPLSLQGCPICGSKH